jgi:hypothetical protein
VCTLQEYQYSLSLGKQSENPVLLHSSAVGAPSFLHDRDRTLLFLIVLLCIVYQAYVEIYVLLYAMQITIAVFDLKSQRGKSCNNRSDKPTRPEDHTTTRA